MPTISNLNSSFIPPHHSSIPLNKSTTNSFLRAPLTWLITGTSSGLGNTLVQRILARGDNVIATARSLPSISALQSLGASTLALDITSPQSVLDAKAAEAIAIYGHIDVLVNNAGRIVLGALENVDHETWVGQFETNVFGAINVTRAFLPHFRERKSGTVVWIGSVAGWKGAAAGGPYCSSKFALEGLFTLFLLFFISWCELDSWDG